MDTDTKTQTIDTVIGLRLRRRRHLLGLTQLQLAVKIGVRFQQIQKYESAKNRVSAARLHQLSQVLEVPLSYFFEGLDDTASASHAEEMVPPKERAELIEQYRHLPDTARVALLTFLKTLSQTD